MPLDASVALSLETRTIQGGRVGGRVFREGLIPRSALLDAVSGLAIMIDTFIPRILDSQGEKPAKRLFINRERFFLPVYLL